MTRRTGSEPDVGALPADKEIVDFLKNCSTPPSVKEVARAFNLPQELRALLRRRLKHLADKGAIARQPGSVARGQCGCYARSHRRHH